MPDGSIRPIDDDELKALVDAEISNALGYVGKLSAQRRKALYYYFGEPKEDLAPPETDGRSMAVSTDLMEVVEWIMPQLVKIFMSSDEAVQFTPQRDGEEDAAEQATAYCNYVFYRQNPGFVILHNWFKDALLEKAGVVMSWWDTREDVHRETYEGLTLDELTILMQQTDVAVAEQRSYPDPDWKPQQQPQPQQPQPQQPQQQPQQQPPMLFDVVLRRTKKSAQIRLDNVPPEEFLISRQARTIEEPGFIGRRLRRTASDLRALGFSEEQIERCTSEDSPALVSQESVERLHFDDEYPGRKDDTGPDPSRREIWLNDCYINVDRDGDGIAELRHVLKCGSELLDDEAVDEHPFSLVTPILMPHRVIGMSIADIVMELMRIKTALLRAYLDGTYIAVNPRMYVDDTKNVDLDGLLSVRPGGIVRGSGPDGVVPLVQPNVAKEALDGLQMLDDMLESRTGVSKHNQFTESNSIQKTAHEVEAMAQSSNQRIELIARVFAETGVSSLFRKILKLSKQHAQQSTMLRLQGKFVPVDPRMWHNMFDVTINVGLGTGNKLEIMQRMGMILQAQKEALGFKLCNPRKIYNALCELTKAAGFKDVSRFWSDPRNPPDPNDPGENFQPPPPPELQIEQMKLQAQGQQAQQKAQVDAQNMQIKAQADQQVKQAELQVHQATEQAKAQASIAISQHDAQLKAQIEALKAQTQTQIEEIKAHYAMQLEAVKHQTSEATEIRIAEIKAAAEIEVARVKANISNGAAVLQAELTAAGQADAARATAAQQAQQPQQPTNDPADPASPIGGVMQRMEAVMSQLAQAHMAPKRIIRDQNGIAQGIAPA